MTRINNHQVIQMVGNDLVVFVDDHYGTEIVVAVDELTGLLCRWGPLAAKGQPFGPDDESTFFHPDEFGAVEQVLDYFIECSKVPIAEQVKRITVTEITDLESLRAFLWDGPR